MTFIGSSPCLFWCSRPSFFFLNNVPHLSLALLLEFLGVTVAPLLCSSALGLTPLSSIDRLEDDLRAASLILGATHENCFGRLPACLASTQCRPFFNSVQGWRSLCLGLFYASRIVLSPIRAFQNLHTPHASSSKLLQTVGPSIGLSSRPWPWNLMTSHLISMPTSPS